MRFSSSVLAVLAQAFIALAQQNNAFNVPDGGYNATAGQSLTLNWTPTSSGTVSLILRSGASSALNAGTYVAQNIQNSGSYTWSIPSDVTRGSDYAIEIVDDQDSSVTNFSPYFVIESTNTVASSTSQISLGASATASPTSSGVISGSQTGSSASSQISSAVSRASSISASASSALASATSSAASASGSSSGSASGSMSTASRSASASSSAAAASSSITVPSTGAAAAMATVFPGLMGALALGALAL